MDFSEDYTDLTEEQLVNKEKILRNEANKIKNLVIERQLSESSGLVVQCCGSANQITDCPLCTFCEQCQGKDKHNLLYGGSKIPNRSNLTDPFTFGETWTSDDTLECNSFNQGLYAIICVKPNCRIRGVIYFGQSSNIRNRIKTHICIIIGSLVDVSRITRVHKHFRQHGDEDNECPLKYLRMVPIKHIKNGSELKNEEAGFMKRFRTHGHGSYGCNDKIEETDPDQGPSEPKKAKVDHGEKYSFNMSDQYLKSVAGRREKEEIVPMEVLVALVMRNHPETNPPFSITTKQLTHFGDYYFKAQPFDQNFVKKLRLTVNPSLPPGGLNRRTKMETDWFVNKNQSDVPLAPSKANQYLFGFAPGLNPFDDTIEQAIEDSTEEIIKLLDPQKLKANPNLLEDMIKGRLGEAPKPFCHS